MFKEVITIYDSMFSTATLLIAEGIALALAKLKTTQSRNLHHSGNVSNSSSFRHFHAMFQRNQELVERFEITWEEGREEEGYLKYWRRNTFSDTFHQSPSLVEVVASR